MAKAENKTKANSESVSAFLESVEDETRQADAKALLKIMKEATGEKAVMWGGAIIGFGAYHYVYESGREGDNLIVGFSPRKANLALYLMGGKDEALLKKLGKYKMAKSCLYIAKLADVDAGVLKALIAKSYAAGKKKLA